MVLQYKEKSSRTWKDYEGKEKLKKPVSSYDFRLLTHDKSKVLVAKDSYEKVMKRFKQIEYFKNRGKR